MNVPNLKLVLVCCYCFAELLCFTSASPASSLFNANKLASKGPKRGNGLRRAVSKDNVRYFLYPNPANETESKVLRIGDAGSLQEYDASKPLTLIIHGFKQNSTDKYPQELKNALLEKGEPSNIVIVSWQGMTLPFKNPHSGLPLSTREASKNVQRVSKHLVEFLTFLKNETKNDNIEETTHLIGYGLGSQIAGVVGFGVKHSTGKSIGRITALSPSGPTHTYTALSEKLDQTDAKFVDVVHTANIGPDESIGHVDFYPNGGTQPECQQPTDSKRDVAGFPGSCSSAMAWDYYTRSVLEDDLMACQANSFLSYKLGNSCKNEVQFGYRVSPSARGDYFLSIRSGKPQTDFE